MWKAVDLNIYSMGIVHLQYANIIKYHNPDVATSENIKTDN